MKISPFQREVLMRAVAGEDRQLPERYDPGPPPFVMPARRWFVPAGFMVPSGSNECQSCRLLSARGLMKSASIPPSDGLPHGNGGYAITSKGRSVLNHQKEQR